MSMIFAVAIDSYDENGAMTLEDNEVVVTHKYASDHPTYEYAPEQKPESNAGIYIALICVILAIVVLFVFK